MMIMILNWPWHALRHTAYLPSVTSESIRTLATTKNSSLIIMEDTSKGIVESRATEAALEAIIEVVESS